MRAIILAAALLLAGAGTAHAGGWAIVTLDNLLEGVVAGEEQTVGFMVLQHGHRPAPGSEAHVVLVHRETGERLSVRARDEGAAGHYPARFALPRAGWWDWHIRTWGREHVIPPLYAQLTAANETQPLTSARPGDLVYYGPTPLPSEPPVPWLAALGALLLAAALRAARKRAGVTMATPLNSRSARSARSLVTT